MKFYYDSWGTIRNCHGDTAMTIHDAYFDPVSYRNGFMVPGSGVNNVILDTDSYQIFSNSQVTMSPSEHISTAYASGPKFASNDKWLVVANRLAPKHTAPNGSTVSAREQDIIGPSLVLDMGWLLPAEVHRQGNRHNGRRQNESSTVRRSTTRCL
jgi:hypothetical protein